MITHDEEFAQSLARNCGGQDEYFKVRIKHFEKYVPCSYDEVLVNRQKEIQQKDRVEEEELFFKTRLPLHYWLRQDPATMMDED